MRLLFIPLLVVCVAAAASPEPAPSSLPEIGRTRATSPACAAMRDLVVPAFTAARRADVRFDDIRKRLTQYASVSTDTMQVRLQRRDTEKSVEDGSAYRDSELARIDVDVAQLLRESQNISKLLADPRLSAGSKDPQLLSERAELIALYDAQQARAAALSQFVQRESTALGVQRVGMGSDQGISSKLPTADRGDGAVSVPGLDSDREPTPPGIVSATPAPGMSNRLGYDPADRNSLGAWSDRLAASVRAAENNAAKTFLLIAQNCH